MAARYAEKLHIVPVFAPAGSTTLFLTYAVSLKNSHWVTFLINMGVMTSDSSDVATVTVIATDTMSNTSDADDVAIPFDYRLSAAVGNDNWGDKTSAEATGMTFSAVDDGKAIVIDVNPDSIPALMPTAKGIKISVDGTKLVTSEGISVFALIEDRYPQAEHLDATT